VTHPGSDDDQRSHAGPDLEFADRRAQGRVDEKIFLPIWVGIFEANAIALQLENVALPGR
jgi:bifunctional DNase/RNase